MREPLPQHDRGLLQRTDEGERKTAFQLVTGRQWRGCAFGGVKGRSQLPGLVTDYLEGRLKVDEFITHRKPLAEINTAFELMHGGDCIRAVVDMRSK